MSSPVCPVCGSTRVDIDRPDLPHLQATCRACRWHFAPERVATPLQGEGFDLGAEACQIEASK